ncbi:Bug family tripartite tricarboxylate transporter substrate binding protein [Salipiger mangrovisoli]|uniref:Tripartite tricarboxylate transporter substrate binding protein n=1 Tax=Salipiger mangrovisoli TaxID=2865933 RepID=A0ABR9X9S3_9RHOB|nr:tripartite tricarboxylate transporter substrate binding protein [Salipiger mangrovisoli]MBE9640360.1 tripartite tricarboxylate transporter substrate binding protein [Salipiger mangrovisoli]
MEINVLKALGSAVVTTSVVLTAVAAQAADYPARTVEVIHQYGPGGGTDRFIRAIAEPMQEATGQSFVPISITGGNGVPAYVSFLQRPANGYTLVSLSPDDVINAALGRIDLSQVMPLVRIQYDQGLLLVSKDSALKSLDDLLDAEKANPGGIKVGVTGSAGFDDALIGLFNEKAGTELATVPFGAAEMVSNTLGGHVDMMYEEYGPTRGLIESGDLVPILLFSDERLPELPDVPTAKESGYDVTLGRWRGFGIKPDTDAAEIETLVSLFRDASANEGYKKIEADSALQYRSEFQGPDEFKAFIDEEIATYTEIMKQLGY